MRDPVQKQQLFTIQETARLLGIGSRTLFARLRQLNIIDAGNVPYPFYVRDGLFKVEQKSYWHGKHQQYMPYAKALVTLKGLNWLNNKLAEELPDARNNQNPSLAR